MLHPLRAKLIFNPASGFVDESPVQLMEILSHLQNWGIVSEVYLVHPQARVYEVAREAVSQGMDLVIVCGGDGTIDTVAGALEGAQTTLGIIPTGTQNNVALSLGIPSGDIGAAVKLLRRGRRVRMDLGFAETSQSSRCFLEVCSVGLLSAIFPAADEIQHGNLARIGDLLSTLVTFPPAEMHITFEQGQTLQVQAPMALVANMPYMGAHFRPAENISYHDHLLDLFLYADLTKLDLIGYAVQATSGIPEDSRVGQYRVSRVRIETTPVMPIMVDGVPLGEGPLEVSVHPACVRVMAGVRNSSRISLRSNNTEDNIFYGG